MTAIVWFRRDLRVDDQPALQAALQRSERVIPCFCFDDRLLAGRHRSGARTQFMLESLADLDASLRSRGSGLVVRRGDPVRELVALATATGAATVHASRDAGPYAQARDAAVARALAAEGVTMVLHPGLFAADDPCAIRTGDGGPYTVFTPFHRSWLRAPRRAVLDAPAALPALPGDLPAGQLPALSALGLRQEVGSPAAGGERAGRAALARFLQRDVDGYDEGRDQLGEDRTSRLSPYLHFGCVSARARGRAPAAGGRPVAAPPALLARLLRTGARRVSRQCAPRTPATLARAHPLERR